MKTKERRCTKGIHQQIIFFLLFSTACNIGYTGVTSLSELLKSNTALTELSLSREDKRKTHKRHPSAIHSSHFLFFSTTDNNIGHTGATLLSESLKSNTTLVYLNLSCENKRKKRHTKRHPSTNHSIPFSSQQQTTTSETQEQRH